CARDYYGSSHYW
nr:immunoglobulin heavy chain junction region [Mus musculus]